MKKEFIAHKVIRENLLNILQNTDYDDLIHIDDKFNNNIYWNIAHCIATQQLLVYYLSNNSFRIDKYWVETYKKGTSPNHKISKQEIDDLAFLLSETSKIMEKDYNDNIFQSFETYSTSFNMELKNIEDAILFNNIHEGAHYGYILAQKRAILR